MGGALAQAVARQVARGRLAAYDKSPERLQEATEAFGAVPLSSEADLARCGTIFLAIKPQVYRAAFAPLAERLTSDHLVASITAGVATSSLAELAPRARLVRLMPNNPARLGAGALALCAGPQATPEDLKYVKRLLEAAGLVVEVPEKLMDTITGLSGSGPAYFYLLIEALADGGVLEGLDRATSLKLAAQTALGAAKMVLETGLEPAELKAQVTSPAGTTAEALLVLEKAGVRGALQAAVRAATERSRELGG